MFGSADLNAEIADCWKLVWNVEPAALMVPLAVLVDALLLADAPPLDVAPVDALLVDEDEEQAARDRAVATTATPAAATCCLRRYCISGTPYGVSCFLGRDEQPGRPVRV
jgi:hypothetical protein